MDDIFDGGFEDFGWGGDEFLIGDCQEDWLNAGDDVDAGERWGDELADDDPSPYDGTYSEE